MPFYPVINKILTSMTIFKEGGYYFYFKLDRVRLSWTYPRLIKLYSCFSPFLSCLPPRIFQLPNLERSNSNEATITCLYLPSHITQWESIIMYSLYVYQTLRFVVCCWCSVFCRVVDNHQQKNNKAAYKCGTRRCDICLTEKTVITAADPSSTLNKRAEVVSTCRHRAKFLYDRVPGAPTWWA